MEKFIAILLTALSTIAYSQNLTIHLKSGKIVDDKVSASSDDVIYGKEGNYKFDEIVKIEFLSEPSESLIQKLSEKEIRFVNKYSDALYPETIIKKNQQAPNIDLKIERAFQEKEIGSVLQILGIVAISGAFIVQYAEFPNGPITDDDLQKRENSVKGLAIGGSAAFLIGTSIILSGDKRIVSILKNR